MKKKFPPPGPDSHRRGCFPAAPLQPVASRTRRPRPPSPVGPDRSVRNVGRRHAQDFGRSRGEEDSRRARRSGAGPRPCVSPAWDRQRGVAGEDERARDVRVYTLAGSFRCQAVSPDGSSRWRDSARPHHQVQTRQRLFQISTALPRTLVGGHRAPSAYCLECQHIEDFHRPLRFEWQWRC
jgi:hypothetical protein